MTNKRTQGDNKHLGTAVMSHAANIKAAKDITAVPERTGCVPRSFILPSGSEPALPGRQAERCPGCCSSRGAGPSLPGCCCGWVTALSSFLRPRSPRTVPAAVSGDGLEGCVYVWGCVYIDMYVCVYIYAHPPSCMAPTLEFQYGTRAV